MCHLLYFHIAAGQEHKGSKGFMWRKCTFLYTWHKKYNEVIYNDKYLLRVGGSWQWLRIASGEVQIFRHTNKKVEHFFFFPSFLFAFLFPVLLPAVDEKTKNWTGRFYFSLNLETKICIFKQVLALPSRLSPVRGPGLFPWHYICR